MMSVLCRMAANLMLLALLLVNVPVRAEYGDTQYSPTIGQAGKDVMWVPTPDEMVTRMLAIAAVTPDDLVYDLGAGDGKIAIAVARQFGARAVSHSFDMDDWRPDATFQASGGHYGYYWVVPARVEGSWTLQLAGATAPATLELRQWFQKAREP